MSVPDRLDTVAVVGNGIIGHGVSQVFAAAGLDVVMVGRSDSSLAAARCRIATSLADFVRHGLATTAEADATLARVRVTTRLEDAGAAQLVVEAVTQDVALKLAIFERLDAICAPPTVLASSSGQPASELVDRVRHRERVIAAHFWFPPQLIPLVEVCAGPETDPDVVAFTCDAIRRAGKRPAVIDREIPGFIGNRLQFALLREAWALWASGAASAEAIDLVVRTSIGRRLAVTGPLESADLGGIATMHAFAEFLQPHLDVAPLPPPAVERSAATGTGVYAMADDVRAGLSAARMDELFRWMLADQGGAA